MQLHRLRTAILSELAGRPPTPVVDIAERLDEHPVTVETACDRLQEHGRIRLAGHGLYTLTDDGRRELDENPKGNQHA